MAKVFDRSVLWRVQQWSLVGESGQPSVQEVAASLELALRCWGLKFVSQVDT